MKSRGGVSRWRVNGFGSSITSGELVRPFLSVGSGLNKFQEGSFKTKVLGLWPLNKSPANVVRRVGSSIFVHSRPVDIR